MKIKMILFLCLLGSHFSFSDAKQISFDNPNVVLKSLSPWKQTNAYTTNGIYFQSSTNALKQTFFLGVRPAASGTTDEAIKALFSSVEPKISTLKKVQILNKVPDQLFSLFGWENSKKGTLFFLYTTFDGAFLWEISGIDSLKKAKEIETQMILCAGKKQYDFARNAGNVPMGAWGKSIHLYAKTLAKSNKAKAEKVYHDLLIRSPFNYVAHIEYAKLTTNKTARLESLRIVLKNAEDLDQLIEASQLLGTKIPKETDYPILSSSDSGFVVILIPLSPCNLWVLEDAAKIYEKITTIPVYIRRLPQPWTFPPATRSLYRGVLEKIAFDLLPKNPNVKSWPREKLQTAMLDVAKKRKDQTMVDQLNQLFAIIKKGEFQWDGDPLIATFQEQVAQILPNAPHTMIVGVTENDIYAQGTRFLFSLHLMEPNPVSLLSYSRMKSFNTETPSRKRLAMRCAKELVPATLKTLSIPRSTDPTCPYSYANGVSRLDQKTLTLAPPVKEAIKKIKTKFKK
jgi:predicted Zn-dependent protease